MSARSFFFPQVGKDYLALLNTKDRHEIRRKLRRLEQIESVNYQTITEKEHLPQAMESFFKLFQLSNDGESKLYD